jgi:hypothetical protein
LRKETERTRRLGGRVGNSERRRADSGRRRLAIRLFAADIPEGLLEDKKSADYFRFGHRFSRTSLHFPRMYYIRIRFTTILNFL